MYMLKYMMSVFVRVTGLHQNFFDDNNAMKHIYFCCESHKVEHNLYKGEKEGCLFFFSEYSTFLYI